NLAAQLATGGHAEADQAAAGQSADGEAARSAAASNGAGAGTAVPAPAPGSAVGAGDGAAPIEELSLPVRACNSLRREGIHTVADLSARSEEQLLAIDNLGPQSLREIKEKLAERGLALSAAGTAPMAGAAATGGAAEGAGDGAAGGRPAGATA